MILVRYQVDGTTGTPLGGFGAGAVKFIAHEGSFAVMTQPPADAYDYVKMIDFKFQLYTKRNEQVETVETMKAALIEGRYDDDAIWPLHQVNFPSINGITVSLTAFSPLDNKNYDQMSLPYAFYEFTVSNTSESQAEIAIGFQITSTTAFSLVEGKGIASANWAVFGKSNDYNGLISAGNDPGFCANGQCNNLVEGTLSKTAVKVILQAKETKSIQFVLAWYDNADPERCYYLGLYDNPATIAEVGLENFEHLKQNAVSLVDKIRASNLPQWLINQTLNTLANLTNNSMYKKDGRVAFAEGQWTCFGTMDQMWHARQIINQLIPEFAWKELEYWARTQKRHGQIHHDFNDYNSGSDNDKSALSTLMAWDDTEHSDYRDIDKWVDLNCGFIISVYETFTATNNQEWLKKLWPYIKKAGQRILDQVELYGNPDYPFTFDESENSYDAGGDPNPYNASMSAVAYKILLILAERFGETKLVERYTNAYETVVASYRARYLNDNFPQGKHAEGYFAGQWLALHLRLGEIWTAEDTDYVLKKLDNYYHPYSWGMGTLKGTYNEWTPYQLTHYGGLLLHTRRIKEWYAMQYDAYRRQYEDRNKVFNHPLDILPAVTEPNYVATVISGDRQYISLPSIWRNYYDLVGFYRDASTRDIWLQPIVLEEMQHEMKDALFITPEGYGTISCKVSGEANQNKEITIKFEQPIHVNKIHLTDHFGENVTVSINSKNYDFYRQGTGYAKELVIDWNGIINQTGLKITVIGEPSISLPEEPKVYPYPPDSQVSEIIDAYQYIPVAVASELAGIDLIRPVGETWYITNIHNFDYLKVDNVEFGSIGSQVIELTVRSTIGGTVEVVLDSVGGQLLGECPIPNTNGEWQAFRFPIIKVANTHDLVLRFAGNSPESLMDVSQFKFIPDDGRLERTGWTVTASDNNFQIDGLLDGDPKTRWHGSYQKVGKWIMLDMGADQTFNKITLETTLAPMDSPRGFEVYLATNTQGANFSEPVYKNENPEGTLVTEIKFNTLQTARYIKIVLTKDDPQHYFSIYELNVWNTTNKK